VKQAAFALYGTPEDLINTESSFTAKALDGKLNH
jgi:hypothetical protein